MLNLRGIKARPHDLAAMVFHKPSLIELHCSTDDLEWLPTTRIDIPMALHVPEYIRGNLLDPASTSPRLRKMAQEIYVHAVGRAMAWAPFFKGRPKVVFHPGGMSLTLVDEKERNAMRAALDLTIQAMIVKAAGKIDILIENLPAHCWFFSGDWLSNIIMTGSDLRETAERNGIGATLDLCHLYLACNENGLDPVEEVRKARSVVRHVHYSDGEGISGEGLEIGKGTLPLAAMLEPLMDLDITAVPEIWFGHEQDGAGFVKAWNDAEALTANIRETA